jgi:hypothetical protein
LCWYILCSPTNFLYYVLKPGGHYMYRQVNIQQLSVLPTQCTYVFCVDLRTNSDYFPIQHSLTGLHNRDGECLLRGKDWVFIYNSRYVWI